MRIGGILVMEFRSRVEFFASTIGIVMTRHGAKDEEKEATQINFSSLDIEAVSKESGRL